MGKNGFVNNFVTGLKAMGGAIIHYFIMFVIVAFTAFIVGGYASIGPGLMLLLSLILIITGIFILGWVYRTFWGWK